MTAKAKIQRGSQRFGHDHAEAFALMQYECGMCGHVEVIWNSRDGVTPFVVDCYAHLGGVRACTGEARHTRWYADGYSPNHKPRPGERIFVDMTPERYRLLTRQHAERMWDDPRLPASQDGRWATVEEFTETLMLDGLTPGAPDLIVVAEPRALFCIVHNREHRADWPWEGEECISERDQAIMEARPPRIPLPHLGPLARFRARLRCVRRGRHAWQDNGSTLGGIWLLCADCRTVEEYLPGCHEPKGGEAVWQERLRRAHVSR